MIAIVRVVTKSELAISSGKPYLLYRLLQSDRIQWAEELLLTTSRRAFSMLVPEQGTMLFNCTAHGRFVSSDSV